MSTIKVKCTDQKLTVTEWPVIASGGVFENHVAFDFCEMWDGYFKIGVFYNVPYKAYKNTIDENGLCVIPPEVTTHKGNMYFGVVGVNEDGIERTSQVIPYPIDEGADDGEAVMSDPTQEIWQQCLAEIARAVKATQEARNEVGKVIGMAEEAQDISKNHASRHSRRGEDPIVPSDIDAADRDHEHEFSDLKNREHAREHAWDGTDPILPVNIGASDRDHKHEVSDITNFPAIDHAYVDEEGVLHIKELTADDIPGGGPSATDEQIAAAVEAYLKEHPPESAGVPSGGKAGQYLRKVSDDDGDVEWADFEIPSEYGLVTYDNTQTLTIT